MLTAFSVSECFYFIKNGLKACSDSLTMNKLGKTEFTANEIKLDKIGQKWTIKMFELLENLM